MGKHAYLLMIHEYKKQLEQLLELLDDERNDIYIHIDKKVKRFPQKLIKNRIMKAGCFFTKRFYVTWGTNSIMNCEYQMLKAACKKEYQYIHLLSGADLPIKSQNEIHEWFNMHNGKEYIHFGTQSYQRAIQSRYNVYHFFMKQLSRNRDKKFWNLAETYSLAFQRRINVNRIKNRNIVCYGGANWFSITGEFAQYVVKHFHAYKKMWYFTQNSDELWLQTICMNTEYKDKLFLKGFSDDYYACMRHIDWERGTPYVFRREDYKELMESSCMFARKFDEHVDKEIIEMIYESVGDKGE